MSKKMNASGSSVVGFSYPVVVKGQPRVRVQISAAHTQHQIDQVLDAFAEVGAELGTIPARGGAAR